MKSTFCFVLWRGSGGTLEVGLDYYPVSAIHWFCDFNLFDSLSSSKQWGQ